MKTLTRKLLFVLTLAFAGASALSAASVISNTINISSSFNGNGSCFDMFGATQCVSTYSYANHDRTDTSNTWSYVDFLGTEFGDAKTPWFAADFRSTDTYTSGSGKSTSLDFGDSTGLGAYMNITNTFNDTRYAGFFFRPADDYISLYWGTEQDWNTSRDRGVYSYDCADVAPTDPCETHSRSAQTTSSGYNVLNNWLVLQWGQVIDQGQSSYSAYLGSTTTYWGSDFYKDGSGWYGQLPGPNSPVPTMTSSLAPTSAVPEPGTFGLLGGGLLGAGVLLRRKRLHQ